MKVLTLFGTRPEIIRLSSVIRLLDECTKQVLVHTGQNYDPSLSDVFMRELKVRTVDYHLGVKGDGFGAQAGQILERVDGVLEKVRPDRLLILGDTNSGLAAIVAARRGIPVYHLEAGNRGYDQRVPEEVNRRVIDHCSDILMPYTHRSAENLVAEGVRRDRIFVVGNPIGEVIQEHRSRISRSRVLSSLKLQSKRYILATMHRSENVDSPDRLRRLVAALDCLAKDVGHPVLVSVHPRTADRIARAKIVVDPSRVRLEPPLGFFDFVKLEMNALGIVTDSGTVQEEACIFRIPNVTIRDVTERPETTECGSNILAGADDSTLLRGMRLALEDKMRWEPPCEYNKRNVSATVARIVVSYCHKR